WVSTFQTVCGRFFFLLTATLFVDFLERPSALRQALACAAMVATLLANELGLTLPGALVLLGFHFARGSFAARLLGGFRAAAPEIAILGLYLPFRYLWIGPAFLRMPALYEPLLGWHVFRNVATFLGMLTRESAWMAGASLAIV